MKFNILTLFPEMYAPLYSGVIGRAVTNGLIEMNIVNIRDFSDDKHKRCDDTPYGGGAGMVMRVQPLLGAVNFADKDHNSHRIYLSPKGERFTQNKAKILSRLNEITLVCGCYEGVDQRFIDTEIDEEISIGDYILTGGELASMVIVNSVSRLISGVLGNEDTPTEESFEENLLEYPHYTKPYEFNGLKVPEVLISGNHKEIKKWRKERQLEITKEKRPDLFQEYLKNNRE